MTPHIEQEICLKEKEWREVHDFVAATIPYRKSLDASLSGIRNGMWAVALAVLVPFLAGFIWIGGINESIKNNAKDILRVETELKEHMRLK